MLRDIVTVYRGLAGDSLTLLPQFPPPLRPALPQLQRAGHPGVSVTTDEGPGSLGTQPPSVWALPPWVQTRGYKYILSPANLFLFLKEKLKKGGGPVIHSSGNLSMLSWPKQHPKHLQIHMLCRPNEGTNLPVAWMAPQKPPCRLHFTWFRNLAWSGLTASCPSPLPVESQDSQTSCPIMSFNFVRQMNPWLLQ